MIRTRTIPVVAVLLFLGAACGGKSGGGLAVGDGGLDANSDRSDAKQGSTTCMDDGHVADTACPSQEISLTFVQGSRVLLPGGIEVEALQVPTFTEATRGDLSAALAPAAQWDRSELPAGACVFRLHGLDASCHARHDYGDIFTGLCDAQSGPPVSPGSFYDLNKCDIAPGCPTANWGNVDGYWWYVNARGDKTDLVICAPACAGSFVPGGACLRLPS